MSAEQLHPFTFRALDVLPSADISQIAILLFVFFFSDQEFSTRQSTIELSQISMLALALIHSAVLLLFEEAPVITRSRH